MTKKCIGCGVLLQSEDEKKLGFIKENKINDAKYCERCYKMMNYNESKIVSLNISTKKIIDKVNASDNFVFFLVDFFNLNKEVMNTFKSIKKEKCLIVSKLDIIPNSFNFDKVKVWLQNTYKIYDNVIFLSSLKGTNISKIYKILDEKNYTKSYIMGYTNAGKSTLLNKLMNKEKDVINTSLIPNTTLGFINIHVGEYTFIDTPGFTLSNTIYNNNEMDLIKKLSPKKFIKPGNYQLKKDSSIIIENKFRITNLDDTNSFTVYMSNLLDIKHVFESNDRLKEYELVTYHILPNTDVVIKSLGFINIKKECDINIYTNNHDLIELRKSFLGSEYYE